MSSIKIFIIDDDIDDIILYQEAFREKGYHFQFAFQQNPALALEQLKRLHPHQLPQLIICDLNMPGLSGFDIVKQVKSSEALKEICFIICSNSSLPSDQQRSLDLGADAYYVKPLIIDQYADLVERISKLCNFESHTISHQSTSTMTGKIKVMLVEDNEDERLFMKEGFTQTGLYEVVAEAENGKEMLDILQQTSSFPQLVVSDLNMPVRNGYEVITDIKTNLSYSHIPVVILTTAPLVPYAERCKKMGACAYFTKPDTFLDYPVFAETIYKDVVEKCLNKM